MIFIGEQIKNLRTSKKLSIRKLSELSGISKTSISDIENNKVNPTINTINKLAAALNININALTSPTEYDKKNIVLLDSGFFTLDQPRIPFDYLSSVANIIKYSDKNFDFSSLTDDEWYSLLKNLSNYTQFELFKINARKKGDIDGNKEE